MELYQLRSFVAVAQEGHLTRAADRLHLSQPSISGHIKALEQEVALPLFVRTPKGMSLTREGELLLASAHEVLKANQSLLNQARALHKTRFVKIAVGILTEEHLPELSDFIVHLRKLYPNIELRLEQHPSGSTIKHIENGDLDCGFIIGAAHAPEVHTVPVKKVLLHIVGPLSWAPQLDQANWIDIAALPWIFTPAVCGINRVATDYFKVHGVEPRVVVTADSLSAINALLAAEVGITLLPESATKTVFLRGKISIWKPASIDTSICFAHRRDKMSDPLIRSIYRVIEDLWPCVSQSRKALDSYTHSVS